MAGEFQSIGGLARSRIARVAADGTLDPEFVPPPIDGAVRAMLLLPEGKVLVAGDFDSVDGDPAFHQIARLRSDGSLDRGFVSAVSGGSVRDIALQGERIIAAGTFRRHLARLLSNGSADPSFFAGGSDRDIHAVEVQPDNRILVGGEFADVHGNSTRRLARLHPDGRVDATFQPNVNFDGAVDAIALRTGGAIVVAGSFTSINGATARGLAQLLPDGRSDPAFVPGAFDEDVAAIALLDDGRLLAAGEFEFPQESLVRLLSTPAPPGIRRSSTHRGAESCDWEIRFRFRSLHQAPD